MGSNFFTRLIETGEFRMTEEGILYYFGTPTFLIPLRTLIAMQKRLQDHHGADYVEEFMKELGEKQTERALERDRDRYNLEEMSRNKIRSFIEDVSNSIALGNFEFKEAESDDIILAVENTTNPFARLYKKEYGEQDHVIDYFIEGLFENPLGGLVEEETKVEEVRCIGKGDESCVFALKSKD